jgi:hypothetical protein
VDVIRMSRVDFQALSSTFRQFRDDLIAHVETIMEQNRLKIASQRSSEVKVAGPEELGVAEDGEEGRTTVE